MEKQIEQAIKAMEQEGLTVEVRKYDDGRTLIKAQATDNETARRIVRAMVDVFADYDCSIISSCTIGSDAIYYHTFTAYSDPTRRQRRAPHVKIVGWWHNN